MIEFRPTQFRRQGAVSISGKRPQHMRKPLIDAILRYLEEGPQSTAADALFEQIRQIAVTHRGRLDTDDLVSLAWDSFARNDDAKFRLLATKDETTARNYVHTTCSKFQITESKKAKFEPFDEAVQCVNKTALSSVVVDVFEILTDDEWFVARLKYEGLTAEEIADVMAGTSRHAIYRMIREIKRKIREALGRKDEEDEADEEEDPEAGHADGEDEDRDEAV